MFWYEATKVSISTHDYHSIFFFFLFSGKDKNYISFTRIWTKFLSNLYMISQINDRLYELMEINWAKFCSRRFKYVSTQLERKLRIFCVSMLKLYTQTHTNTILVRTVKLLNFAIFRKILFNQKFSQIL